MAEEPLASVLSTLPAQYASLNANYLVICRDLGEIKTLLEKQNGRVRALETVSARREEQVRVLTQDVSDLKEESRSKGGLLWNAFNSLAAGIATYLAMRS